MANRQTPKNRVERELPEAGFERAPTIGYDTHLHASRTAREQSYQNTITWDLLVRNPEIADEQKVAIEKAWELLYAAELFDSRSQFASALLLGIRTPILLADAAHIANCSRQWFRKLETQGRITLHRVSSRQVYIMSEDLRKMMEGRV